MGKGVGLELRVEVELRIEVQVGLEVAFRARVELG